MSDQTKALPECWEPVPTFSKLERDSIFQLLKPLGSLDVVKGFADDIEFLLKVDVESFSARTSVKQQYEALVEILEKSNALIEQLQKFCFDDLTKIDPANLQTVILIQNSFISISSQNESESATQNAAHCLPFNYPTELADDLYKLRDAVAHAANEVELKRGNSNNRNPKVFRKMILAKLFVTSYHNRFNELPQVSEKGAANKVLNKLFKAAGLPENAEKHSLRGAVEHHNGIPKKKRVRKSRNVKDET